MNSRFGSMLFGCFVIVVSGIVGLSSGLAGAYLMLRMNPPEAIVTPQSSPITQEDKSVIEVTKNTLQSVVSVVVTKDLPRIQRNSLQSSTEAVQVGAGSGFIVSADGYIVTNRHVIDDTSASYTVVMNDGEQVPAKVLARDTFLDIGILKIERNNLPFLRLGDSDKVEVGQRVIAVGNALGEFQNSVTTGIISGKLRSIVASDGNGSSERLENIFQTDTSINPGNSGGPLLDYVGNVIGVNVAVSRNAENIAFAIPINDVKKVIDSVIQFGVIKRPYIGVRYLNVTAEVAKENNLKVEYGALIQSQGITGGGNELV
jgi:serine protease Do